MSRTTKSRKADEAGAAPFRELSGGAISLARPKRGRANLQDMVYARLKHGLMVGAFVPGQILTLRKFAEALGTSPMPVREAIAQLVTANVLESLANGSVAVPRLTRKRFVELTEVRASLEGMAAAAATPLCTPELLRELAALNQQLLRAIKDKDPLKCLAKNQEFHFTLYEASKSEILLPIIESLWLQAGPTMYFSLSGPNVVWDASVHEEIIAALKAGNATAVRKGVEKDIRKTSRYLLNSATFRTESDPLMKMRLSLAD